jgi:DNA polymerase V
MIALIDCNNFFVSCERLFRPELQNKPVVVLSSNDGCAIARSNEVKALKIPMGAPAFKYKQVFEKHNIVKFSGNFELYGNISRRITEILTGITPLIEIYSVDESFVDLSELSLSDYKQWGAAVRQAILEWVGIPVSVGIAPSKTLAKVAIHKAKKDLRAKGVCVLGQDSTKNQGVLTSVPITDVWGVGRRFAPKLKAEGIHTALGLSQLAPKYAQQLMGIQGRQMVAELNGEICHPVRQQTQIAKSISRTRTFGQDITDQNTLRSAVADFATRASFTLRSSNQLAKKASLFVATNRFKANYTYRTAEIVFNTPTNDTGHIISQLCMQIEKTVPPGFPCHRAGVLLHELCPLALQTDLFNEMPPKLFSKSQNRMRSIDNINQKFGKDKVMFASRKLGDAWSPKKNNQSPRYLTRWSELPKIKPV